MLIRSCVWAGVLHDAYRYYNKPGAVVVMVVQPGERNIVDQRLLEFALWDRFRVQTVRLSLAEVRTTTTTTTTTTTATARTFGPRRCM